MSNLSVVFFVCLAIQCSSTVNTEFCYNAQHSWTGVCNSGNQNQQSPIAITTSKVIVNVSLPNLQFYAWDQSYTGKFENTGHNVQFNPIDHGAATIINHLGTYSLQQFHMHWGRKNGEGSEHRINGEQAELEIHFVHTKRGVTDTTQRDYITVVAVLGDVNEWTNINDPWAKLNVKDIQCKTSSGINVTGLVFDQLLPNNRDYYYYQGSLTTPPCSENVQWFVLKERISVPCTFMEQLREIQEANGESLEFNFRDLQILGDRVIMTAF